jgi:Spy/CpxP family protein refolding chaperone
MSPSGRRSPWLDPRLLLVVFLIFSVGALVGALTMRFALASEPAPRAAVYFPVGDNQVALEQMVKSLDLNPAQAAQLELILDDFAMYVQMLQTQMDEVRASGKVRILNILDDRQRARFEKMMGDLQARRP